MSKSAPIASTVWRLADSTVLIGVKQTADGPVPLVTEVSGEPVGVAFTDPAEIRALLPDDYRMFQIPLVEFLGNLPPTYGLVVDPRTDSPVYIPAEERDVVLLAALPFPTGAPIKVKQSADGPPAFLAAAGTRLAAVPEARRVYCTRYQVADAREKLLVAYDCELGGDAAVAEAVVAAAAAVELPDPMKVTALDDIPEQFRDMILAGVEPFHVRGDLRASA
jgi:hypothetical protein